MKKIMIFAAFAAVLSLASCQKEMDVEKDSLTSVESPVFTAEISEGSKTTLDTVNGKVSWEETDEITVTDNASNSAVYKIESIDGTTGKATFIIKDGETPLGDGPYTATYGTAPAISQVYSANLGKLYMTAPATSSNSFTFDVQCGLLEIKLTKSGVNVKSVSVTTTPDAGGNATRYYLTCAEPQSISAQKSFCIAVPAGSYDIIKIMNSSNSYCKLTASSGIKVENNHIKPLTIVDSKLSFTSLPAGTLPGEFKVDKNKWVHFSKGNLRATINASGTPTAWKFATNQYDYLGEGGANKNIGTGAGDVDFFGWSTDDASFSYGISNSKNNDDYSGGFVDWGIAYCNSNSITPTTTWRTLTKAEWDYLFNTRTVNGGKGDGKSYSLNITYGDKKGLVLYPDDYTGSALSGTVSTLPDGVVFLPASGRRDGSNFNYVGSFGYYWSSVDSGSYAYRVNFSSSRVYPINPDYRNLGYSVRLVTDVK